MNLGELFLQGATATFLNVLRMILVGHFSPLPYDFSTTEPPRMTYDFIVVGSGPGGSSVASRLSETSASVLLLEAGGPAPPESAVPALAFFLLGGDYDWKIKGKKMKNAQYGYVNGSSYWFSGKAMGGSSALNGMVYVRGNKKDYDNWANMGNPGWDWQSVLPYFMKSENFQGNLVPGSGGHHGKNGPIPVSSRATQTSLTEGFRKAGQELGYDIVDGSGPNQIGVAPVYTVTHDGVRASAGEIFLRPVVDRPNLHIRPNAMVTRILFNSKKRAVGVKYMFQGKTRIVRARKEVIISAGALNTPKLLMLSGVGPRKHLEEMGIPIIAAVEGVGRNLMDHVNIYLTWLVDKGNSLSFQTLVNPAGLKSYLRDHSGLLGDSPGPEGNSFFNVYGDDPTWSDIQVSTSSLSFSMERGLLLPTVTGMKPEVYEDYYGQFYSKETLTMNPCVLRPRSRGSVTLASVDPLDNPVVDMNFFDHPDDMKIMIRGIRMTQKFANTRALKALGARKRETPLKLCSHHPDDSDQYWECYVRQGALSLWHYAGTAKMAPDSDPMGVVNERLRVRGVTGLRVVDASIMPLVVTSNTMAPTYMIGDKAADMIKEDWGYRNLPPRSRNKFF